MITLACLFKFCRWEGKNRPRKIRKQWYMQLDFLHFRQVNNYFLFG